MISFQLFNAVWTALFVLLPLALGGMLSPSDTITWGGDNSRSGYQPGHNMDPAVVGSSSFGQIFQTLLPGNYRGNLEQIYAQPLVYTLDDGVQYVFVATTQNNVYKINAKTGKIVLSRNLHIPFLTSELGNCVDINPVIGSTATGVIDPSTDTWYLTAKTYLDQSDQIKGRSNGRYYFHAIDVNTLTERAGFPRDLEGTLSRNTEGARMFQGGIHHQRPALLQHDQFIYAGFASHCVQYNFTGWIMGWDKSTGDSVEAYAMEGGPEANSIAGGGVWMSGGGIASDGRGSIFFSTGNGYTSQLHGIAVAGRQPPSALEEAAVHMSVGTDGSLTVVDFFMPWEKEQLDGADKDLGTSPLELLPTDVFTCANVKRMGVVTGKSGKTYFLDIDNLGGYQNGPNHLDAVPQVTQNENSVYAGAGVYPLEGGYIYINTIQYPTHVFKFSCDSNGNPAFTHVADSPEKNAYILGVGHGTVTSLNGQPGTGLVWTSDVEGYNLRVYNAVPSNGLMTPVNAFNAFGVTKFSRPVFGDGRVYLGTTQGILYGFGSPINLSLNCSSPYEFGTVVIGRTSDIMTINCQANTYTQIKSVGLAGNNNFNISGVPQLPFDIAEGANFSFQAVFAPKQPGPLSSNVIINTTADGYTPNTPISLKGTGESLSPLLGVTPNTLAFSGVVTGQQLGGVNTSAIFVNEGVGVLNITSIDYSVIKEGGPTVTPNITAGGSRVGPFTFMNFPTSIPGKSQVTVIVNFNPSTSGNFAAYLTVHSNGGTKIFDIVATSGTYPVALVEFQAADGSGRWIPYSNTSAFSFGNVKEQDTKTLKMRLTNKGDQNAGPLSVTVSKPPFGVPGIVGAKNSVDLAEGTSLAAGQSATADLFCFVPKSQVNVDSYSGTAQWTMNTGDPTAGKMFIQFACNAVSEQVGPLADDGSAIYRYKSCAIESNPGRQLTTQLYDSPSNTNAKCITACAAAGWKYCGTQYQRECWGGNSVPIQSTLERECNYACSGSATEICGGNGFFSNGSYISIFDNPALAEGVGNNTPKGPTAPQNIGAFSHVGCYTEGSVHRVLPDSAAFSSSMTLEYCASQMGAYGYFGVEYGSECYGGNALGQDSALAPTADCSMPCPGNSSEACGGGNRLQLYQKTKTSSMLPASSSVSSMVTSTSSISSTSGPNSTTLVLSAASPLSFIANSSTSSFPTSSASSNISSLASPSTTVPTTSGSNSTTLVPSSSLTLGPISTQTNSMATSPSTTTLATYTLANSTTSDFSTSTASFNASSPSSSTSTLPTTSGSNTTTLVLSSSTMSVPPSTKTNSTATITSIASALTSTLANSAITGLPTSTASTITLSLVSSSTGLPTTASSGPNSTTLILPSSLASAPLSSKTNSTTTVLSTTSFPNSALANSTTSSFSTSAVPISTASPSFSNSISQTLSNSTTLTSSIFSTFSTPLVSTTGSSSTSSTSLKSLSTPNTTISTTTMTSTTTPNSSTGTSLTTSSSTGTNKSPTTLSTSSSASSSAIGKVSTTSSTVTSSSTTPTPTKAAVAQIPDWNYLGCFKEGTGARALASYTFKQNNMTVDYCASLTVGKYLYFGVEYSRECYGGNTLSGGSVAAPASDCSQPCMGNKTEICGGPNRLNLYQATDSKKPILPSVVASATNFTYYNCVVDLASNTRTLPKLLLAANDLTAERCLSMAHNYKWAGLEYGRECWAANQLSGTATNATSDTECNMTCAGNQTTICGAGKRLTTYRNTLLP